MIDPKELRISNWILVEIHPAPPMPHQVKAQDIADMANGKITLNSVEGIPLTPDILEACGFKNKKDKFNEPYLGLSIYNGIDGADLRYYDNDTKSVGLFTRDSMIGYNQYYLHQVQNIFFALTGKELQVNLKENV